MKRLTAVLCAVLAALLLFTACGLLPAAPATEPVVTTTAEIAPVPTVTADGPGPADWSSLSGQGKVGFVLPDFSAETADHGTLTLSELLKDHELVLINLWASWCGPCMMEFPFLEEAYAEYGDRVEILALSVEAEDSLAVIRGVAKDKGLSFPMGRDENYNLATTFSVTGIPTSLLVDRSRTVVWMSTGAMSSAQEARDIFNSYLSGGASPEQAVYTVTVLDQDGNPVPGCAISFCTEESCVSVICDGNGRAEYVGEPYAYRIQVLSLPEGYDFEGGDELFAKAAGDEITVNVTRLGG